MGPVSWAMFSQGQYMICLWIPGDLNKQTRLIADIDFQLLLGRVSPHASASFIFHKRIGGKIIREEAATNNDRRKLGERAKRVGIGKEFDRLTLINLTWGIIEEMKFVRTKRRFFK